MGTDFCLHSYGDPCLGCPGGECCALVEPCTYQCLASGHPQCIVADLAAAVAPAAAGNARVLDEVVPVGAVLLAMLVALLVAVARGKKPPSRVSRVKTPGLHATPLSLGPTQLSGNAAPGSGPARVAAAASPPPGSGPASGGAASDAALINPPPPDEAGHDDLSKLSPLKSAGADTTLGDGVTASRVSDVPAPVVTPPALQMKSALKQAATGVDVESPAAPSPGPGGVPPPTDRELRSSSQPPVPAECGFHVVIDDKRLVATYGVKKTSVEHTCYCHHFSEDGRHCVVHGLPPSAARRCDGVMYADKKAAVMNFFGTAPIALDCKPKRGGHGACNAKTCPFIKADLSCPYMWVNPVANESMVSALSDLTPAGGKQGKRK